jgi:hypothetical protein
MTSNKVAIKVTKESDPDYFDMVHDYSKEFATFFLYWILQKKGIPLEIMQECILDKSFYYWPPKYYGEISQPYFQKRKRHCQSYGPNQIICELGRSEKSQMSANLYFYVYSSRDIRGINPKLM